MHFGREDIDLTNFEYRLPADGPLTATTLPGERDSAFCAYVGAPSWGNKHWVGQVYPREPRTRTF